MLRTKLRRWLAAAIVLIAGGTGITQALIAAARTHGLTCGDAEAIVNFMKANDINLVVPFVDHVVPEACDIAHGSKCSRLDDGTICESGRRYGPGLGGGTVPDPETFVFVPALCDVADGTAISCTASDGSKPWLYDPVSFDKTAFIKKLSKKLDNDGFLGDLPEEEE